MHRVFGKKSGLACFTQRRATKAHKKGKYKKRGHTPIKSPIHSSYTLGVCRGWGRGLGGGRMEIYCDCEEGEISGTVAIVASLPFMSV